MTCGKVYERGQRCVAHSSPVRRSETPPSRNSSSAMSLAAPCDTLPLIELGGGHQLGRQFKVIVILRA